VVKPGDFYVSIVDLFAILLPGAVAAALLLAAVGNDIPGEIISLPDSTFGLWVAFIIAAYLIGHVIFLLGSFLDGRFESLRKWRLEQGAISAVDNDQLYFAVQILKNKIFDDELTPAPLNNFQWVKSVLVQEKPNAIAEVNRLEADSKFFRSLSVISFLSIFLIGFNTNDLIGIILIVITIMCFLRYYERRLKSNTLAYLHLLTFYRLNGLTNLQM